MGTPLNPKVFLTDLTQGSYPSNTIAEHTISYRDTIDLDRVGSMGLQVLLGTLGANTILAARPPRGNVPVAQARSTPRPILAEFSFSGQLGEIDHRAMVEKLAASALSTLPSLGFDNDDLASAMAMSQVDELTLVNVHFQDLLTADPGALRVLADAEHDTGLLPPNTPLPWVKGILRNNIGNPNWASRYLLDWWGVLAAALRELYVTVSYKSDPLAKALELAVTRLAGLNLGNGNLPGTYGHIVYDTASSALNLAHEVDPSAPDKPSAVLGFIGDEVYCSIQQGADGSDPEVAPVGDGMMTTSDLTTMVGQMDLEGGKASQGLPVGATITSGVILNRHLYGDVTAAQFPGANLDQPPPTPGLVPGPLAGAQPSLDWQASLPVVGVYISEASGGAYYYPGDNAYYAIGICPGIKELVYDEAADDLYAATKYGIRTHKGGDLDNLPWVTVEGLRYPCDRVWVHRAKVGGVGTRYLFAQVNAGQAGVDGIWVSPPVTQEDEDAPGWQRLLNQPKIVAFTPIPDTLECAFTIGDRPYHVYTYGPLAGGTASISDPLEVPLFESVTRLDPGPSGKFIVLTGAGSRGLYMSGGSPWVNLNPGSAPGQALRDVDGQPINVNRLVMYSDYHGTINGVTVAALACTNRGLWVTSALTGAGWHSINGQSGLAGEDVTFAMVSGIRQMIDRVTQPLYAIIGSDMCVSLSGGLQWAKTIDKPLNLGVAFGQLATPSAPGDPRNFPDWEITAVGSAENPGVNFAPGTVAQLAPDAAINLPPGFQIAKRFTYNNTVSYRIVNTLSTAPYFGIESMSLSDIFSGVEVDQAVAEETLIAVGVEALYNASLPQTLVQLPTWFNTQESKVRRLRPGHLVSVTYHGTITRLDPNSGIPIATEYAEYDNEHFFVLTVEKDMADGSSTCEVRLTLGKFLLKTPPTPDELSANLLYGVKNTRRYGTP